MTISVIGSWRRSFDRDSNTHYWTNSDTGQMVEDNPEIVQALTATGGNIVTPQGQNDAGQVFSATGQPGAWNYATGSVDALNPYTTQRAQLEKMLVTSGPRAGQYLYIDANGNQAYGLRNFNQLTGGNYTDAQIPTSSTQLDIAKMNDSSGFANQFGDVLGDVLMGAVGFLGGPTAGLLGSFASDPNGDAASQRTDNALRYGSIAGSLYGGLSGSGGASTSGSYISDAGTNYGTDASQVGTGSGGALTTGGTTDNYFGDYVAPEGDTGYGDYGQSNTAIDYSQGDSGYYGDYGQSGNTTLPVGSPYTDATSNIDYQALAQKFGPTLAKALLGGSGADRLNGNRQTQGQGILDQFGSDPLGSFASSLPFLLAVQRANSQSKDLQGTINQQQDLVSSIAGNQSPYMNAILNPYDQQTGTGRASLLQDQGLRSIRGSSFGDQSLNSYDYTRDLGRGDLASRALMSSVGQQQTGLDSILKAKNLNNVSSNALIGAGLNASGRLFSPQSDPFGVLGINGGLNIKSLLGDDPFGLKNLSGGY